MSDIKVLELKDNLVQLEIVMDIEDFDRALQSLLGKSVKSFDVPGFRKGKAPRQLIEKYYCEDVIYKEAVAIVCLEAYKNAITKKNLMPLEQPEISVKESDLAQVYTFTAKAKKPNIDGVSKSINNMPNQVLQQKKFSAYKGNQPYIFVSYAHKDSAFVLKDIQYLSNKGYRIWYDEGIEFGNNWPDELAISIKNCTQFIVYLSNNSILSEHVKDEIYFALANKLKITPIYIEDIILPPGLGLKIGSKQGIMAYLLEEDLYRNYLGKAISSVCCKSL